MPPRTLIVLLVAALTLVAGCLQDAGRGDDAGAGPSEGGEGGNDARPDPGDDPGGADPPGPGGDEGPPTGDESCTDLRLHTEPQAFRPGERVQLTVSLGNCGSDPVHVTLPACAQTGAMEVVMQVDGETWHVANGPLQPDPVSGSCESFERTVQPGASFDVAFQWDGRLKTSECRAMRCADDAWAPHGAYRVTASVTSAEGESWRTGSWVEFLAPELPPYENDGEVVFVLDDAYEQGDTVRVQVRNEGERTFRYRTYYAACDLQYFDADGYPFIVPAGTHCDIANDAPLAPGETVTLFNWTLEECVVDNWGCSESRPLAPGTYHVAGTFHEDVERWWERDDATTRAGATFRVT